MKRNLLGLFAVVLAIAVSSFTARVDTTYYLIYDGTGTQKDITNYVTPYETDVPDHITGTGKLNWFKVVDVSSNGISTTEFNNAFDSYDVVAPSTNLLSDETTDVPGGLDIKQ